MLLFDIIAGNFFAYEKFIVPIAEKRCYETIIFTGCRLVVVHIEEIYTKKEEGFLPPLYTPISTFHQYHADYMGNLACDPSVLRQRHFLRESA